MKIFFVSLFIGLIGLHLLLGVFYAPYLLTRGVGDSAVIKFIQWCGKIELSDGRSLPIFYIIYFAVVWLLIVFSLKAAGGIEGVRLQLKREKKIK